MRLNPLQKNHLFGRPGPLVMVIMDGVGLAPDRPGNAVRAAHTPTLDRLMQSAPWTQLAAHGRAVGMPSDADMGNSEVGHNALGAGRVFEQGASLVQRAIEEGTLFEGAGWREVSASVAASKGTLHLIGLLSDGNVHSHIEHLKALITRAREQGLTRVAVHALLDGRDVPATSALDYVAPLEAWLAKLGPGFLIASGGGRMTTTMDRYEADWSMVERGWRTHVLGEGKRYRSAAAAIEALRSERPGVIDQDLPPFVVEREGTPAAPIVDGDAVIFFNFRGDRAIEMSKALCGLPVPFERVRQPNICFAGMMTYDGDTNLPPRILVPPPAIDRTLSQYLCASEVTQFACSETQKFGHVTYFWNGNRSGYVDPKLEKYLEVPSDRVAFEERPWMKAAEITDAVLTELAAGTSRFLRLNYANGDMVGHTGSFDAARLAVEAVDLSLARLLTTVERVGGVALITADHGNADEMFELDKRSEPLLVDGLPKPKTAHTLNPVPAILFDPKGAGGYRFVPPPKAGLANMAATVMALLGFQPPEEYEQPLIEVL